MIPNPTDRVGNKASCPLLDPLGCKRLAQLHRGELSISLFPQVMKSMRSALSLYPQGATDVTSNTLFIDV